VWLVTNSTSENWKNKFWSKFHKLPFLWLVYLSFQFSFSWFSQTEYQWKTISFPTFQRAYHFLFSFKTLESHLHNRVDGPVTKHLSAQGRPDPWGGLHCFWCQNKTWTSSLSASDTLTIIKNELGIRKLRPPKVKGFKNSKTQTTEHYKGWFSNTKQNSLYIALFIVEFQDDL
jgi:hypothetical protein